MHVKCDILEFNASSVEYSTDPVEYNIRLKVDSWFLSRPTRFKRRILHVPNQIGNYVDKLYFTRVD